MTDRHIQTFVVLNYRDGEISVYEVRAVDVGVEPLGHWGTDDHLSLFGVETGAETASTTNWIGIEAEVAGSWGRVFSPRSAVHRSRQPR